MDVINSWPVALIDIYRFLCSAVERGGGGGKGRGTLPRAPRHKGGPAIPRIIFFQLCATTLSSLIEH